MDDQRRSLHNKRKENEIIKALFLRVPYLVLSVSLEIDLMLPNITLYYPQFLLMNLLQTHYCTHPSNTTSYCVFIHGIIMLNVLIKCL